MNLVARLATANPGKLRELQELVGPDLELRPPPADYAPPEETGTSYLENALLKARDLREATGEASLGDDSGLEVDALSGRPGIHSARYAADEAGRIARLLAELQSVPAERRDARFRCVLALVLADGRAITAQGVCEGTIALVPRGTGGFGYDPIFLLPDLGLSFAEVTAEEKNRRSHRSAAARALLERLRRGDLGTI